MSAPTNSTMNTLQTILGALCLLSGVGYAFVAVSNYAKSSAPRVGDVFVHANPGTSLDPNEANEPFALIYTVKEISGDRVRIERHSIYTNGKTNRGEGWESARKLGAFDERIVRGPQPDEDAQ